jgi:hypothetical protein
MENHMKGLYCFSLALLIASAANAADAAAMPVPPGTGMDRLVAANDENKGAGNGNYTEGVQRREDRRTDQRVDRRDDAANAVGASGADAGIERRADRRENRRVERRTGGAAPLQEPGSSPSP